MDRERVRREQKRKKGLERKEWWVARGVSLRERFPRIEAAVALVGFLSLLKSLTLIFVLKLLSAGVLERKQGSKIVSACFLNTSTKEKNFLEKTFKRTKPRVLRDAGEFTLDAEAPVVRKKKKTKRVVSFFVLSFSLPKKKKGKDPTPRRG